jgi:hypothetical protein
LKVLAGIEGLGKVVENVVSLNWYGDGQERNRVEAESNHIYRLRTNPKAISQIPNPLNIGNNSNLNLTCSDTPPYSKTSMLTNTCFCTTF